MLLIPADVADAAADITLAADEATETDDDADDAAEKPADKPADAALEEAEIPLAVALD